MTPEQLDEIEAQINEFGEESGFILPLITALREAREAIADARIEAQDSLCLRDQLHRSRVVAEDERDKARAEVEVLARDRYAEQQRASKAEKERDEARADYEAQTDAWLKEHHRYNEAMDEVEKLKAEVKRLREVVRQVHALAEAAVRGTAVGAWLQTQEIHKITKGMVE